MSKRKRFIITSILLSICFFVLQFLENRYRFHLIGGLSLMTLILFAWSLKEGLGKNMTLITLVLPVMFTLGVGLFWFLLPSTVFAQIPVLIFYGVGIYALCLTSNIYTVAAVRTIALLRAARGVGFVLTLVTSFLIFDAIISLRTPLQITTPLLAISSFLLIFQGLWTIPLDAKPSKELFSLSAVSSLIIAQVSLGLFFWPVTVVVGSLFLTIAVYILLGLGQAKLETRLFSQTVREHLLVGLLVFIGMYFATHWGA